MSPLRLNELCVGLCPDRLIVARFRSVLGRRLIEQYVHPVQRDAVDELKQLAGGSRISVVLSNHFVRYAVLQWSSTLASVREWTAFALHTFISIYGDVAKTWEIQVSGTGKGNPAIACAVDQGLLQSLRQIPRLASIRPHLVAAFNARRSELPEPSLWFLVQERGRLTIGLIVDRHWKSIRNRQAPDDWPQSLEDLLDREAAACAHSDTHCAVACSEDEIPKRAGRYRILDLTLPRNADPASRPIRMALSA